MPNDMTAPTATNRHWTELLARAREWPVLAPHRSCPDDELVLLLQAAVAVAWWIRRFAPHLAEAAHLDLLLIGWPGGPGGTDEGRPYQLLPYLLDRPQLTVGATLVVGDAGPPIQKRVPHARPHISLAEQGLAGATVCPADLSSWWRSSRAGRPDLCIVYHPSFDERVEFWAGLRDLLAGGVPVACFARGPEKVARDAWLLEAYGYELDPELDHNPFAYRRPEARGHGAWAAIGWRLAPDVVPAPDHPIDRDRLARARHAQQFMEHEFQVWNPLEFVGRVHTVDGDDAHDAETFIGLPDHYVVSRRTGEVWAVESDGMTPAPGGIRLPTRVLETYPGPDAHPFERLLWAVETYIHEYRPREAGFVRATHDQQLEDMEAVLAQALHGKATAEEIATITELYRGGTPATAMTPGSEPLFSALRKRDFDRAAELVGTDAALLEAQDEDGRTPLFYVMAAGRYELARRWLEAGADPNHLDHEGFGIVHDAAKRHAVEPLDVLQRYGGNLDLRTPLGFTPALIALHYGSWPVLAHLLAEGVDLRAATLVGISVANQYEHIKDLPRVLRVEIERQLAPQPFAVPIVTAPAPQRRAR